MSLDHLSLLAIDVEAFAVAVASGPPAAPIAGCPGWDLAALGVHLGDVHRWVIGALATGAPPPAHRDPAPPVDGPGDLARLADWVRVGADQLIGLLAALDPAAPTWHPFPVEPKVAGLWRRRQSQEASVHRWDAQRAIGQAPIIERELAADGVDEYWTVMLPRMLIREDRITPASVFEVVLTDTGQRWTVDGTDGRPVHTRSAPGAVLQGEATPVLLRLWGRPVEPGSVVVDGDPAVAEAWLALGGA